MSLEAVKEDDNKVPEQKKKSAIERFDELSQKIFDNADDIISRKLENKDVKDYEFVNQEDMMKQLNLISKVISLQKKHGRIPDDDSSGHPVVSMLGSVKGKKNSVSDIVQKLDN